MVTYKMQNRKLTSTVERDVDDKELLREMVCTPGAILVDLKDGLMKSGNSNEEIYNTLNVARQLFEEQFNEIERELGHKWDPFKDLDFGQKG